MKKLYKNEDFQSLISFFQIFIGVFLMSLSFGADSPLPVRIGIFAAGFLMWFISEFVVRKIRKKQTGTKIVRSFMLINLVLAILLWTSVAVGILAEFIENPKKVKEGKENISLNMADIQREILDFENYKFTSVTIDPNAKPDSPSSYVLLQKRVWNNDVHRDQSWELTSSKPVDEKDRYTKEDLDSFEVFVFAVSHYASGDYTRGGIEGTVHSESVELYYYNPHTGSFFGKGKIEGKKLQETESRWEYEISTDSVIGTAKADIGYKREESNNSVNSFLSGGIIIGFLSYYIIGYIVREIKKIKQAKQALT